MLVPPVRDYPLPVSSVFLLSADLRTLDIVFANLASCRLFLVCFRADGCAWSMIMINLHAGRIGWGCSAFLQH